MQLKTEVFMEHLQKVFKQNETTKIEMVSTFLDHTHQLELLIDKFSKTEIKTIIQNLDDERAPGYDLIT